MIVFAFAGANDCHGMTSIVRKCGQVPVPRLQHRSLTSCLRFYNY